MSDVFREVDEALREDRLKAIWTRWGTFIIAAMVAIPLATAGWVAWQRWQRSIDEAATGNLAVAVSAMAAGNTDVASAALAAAVTDGDAVHAGAARLLDARLKADAGDKDGAIAQYRAVAGDSSLPRSIRSLAQILAVMHAIGTAPADQLHAELAPLTEDDQPWRFQALELDALVSLDAGDGQAARTTLQRLVDDPETPAGIRSRASDMLAQIGGQS